MAETRRNIQLREGDRNLQATIRKNKETILHLRQENKRLYRELAEVKAGDERVIKEAFHVRGMEKDGYRNTSVKEACMTLNRRVLSIIKRVNALKHITRTYQQHLDELTAEYERMKSEGSSAGAHARRTEDDATNLRTLENSLEKMRFKCDGAENVMTNYLKIKSHLKEEGLTFQGQLNSLEAEILKHKEELRQLQVINNDAQCPKEVAMNEHIQRKSFTASYRRKVDEGKAQAEWADGEILENWIPQEEAHQRLEKTKVKNETVLQQLNEQKELLSQQFQDMKHSREATLSRAQRLLDTHERRLQAQQQRCDAAEERLEWLVSVVCAARARVERLADKLRHITLSDDTVAEASPDSGEFVVKLVAQCELKLQLLCEELQGTDLAAVRKEMEGEEFYVRSHEGELSTSSTHNKLPEDKRLDLFDEEEKTGEDNQADVISTEASINISDDG